MRVSAQKIPLLQIAGKNNLSDGTNRIVSIRPERHNIDLGTRFNQRRLKKFGHGSLFIMTGVLKCPKQERKMKNRKNDPRIPPPDIVESVRQSARNGAASLLGHSREDVLEEMAANTVEKYLVQVQKLSRVIVNPRSWAYRVGRNEVNAWIAREARHVSLDDPSISSDEQNSALLNEREFHLRESLHGQEEVLQALPELFDWFQDRVINQLEEDDRLFYERFYVDRCSEAQLAAAFKITPKAVAQRWRRLLVRMRRSLINELPKWNRGNELFIEAFKDPKSLVGLLCLIRLFVDQGVEAIRGIVESFNGQ